MFNDFDLTHQLEIGEGAFRGKCDEIRGVVEKVLADFCMLGKGDSTKRKNYDGSFDSVDDSPAKGVPKEHSLKARLLKMFDFRNLDPIVFCLHTYLINNQLLESLTPGMPFD